MDKYFDGELLSGFEESPKTTTGRYEQLGYCEYRDVKTGLVASNYIEVMNQQSNRIADLEAKLAEREKALEYARYPVARILDDLDQLKHQLAEKEKEIERLTKSFANKNNEDLSTTINGVKFTTEQIIALQQVGYSAEYDKNQTAIDELEQLKHDIWTNQQDDGWLDEQVDIYELTEMIDQQIRALKGEV